jgi:hydrogenase/urease accessory protein HupE
VSGSARRLGVAVLAATVAMAAPGDAAAHGLHGDGASSFLDFVRLGVRHMVGGWDHLLFIAGVVVLAGSVGLAAKLISLFVLGHSTTLLVATLAGWQLSPTVVDVAITASVAYVGWRILKGQPERWLVTGAVIFAFGLVHGLGLATRLQALALPDGWPLVARVLAFNVGVEIGQLLALTALVGAGLLAARLVPRLTGAKPVVGTALVAVGLIGAGVLSFVAAQPSDAPAPAEAETARCVESAEAPPSGTVFGGHPERAFYGPDEEAAEGDLGHVLGDGYIVVRYRADSAGEQVDALEEWVAAGPFGVVAAPEGAAGAPALEARTRERVLRCESVDLEALSAFRDGWLQRG